MNIQKVNSIVEEINETRLDAAKIMNILQGVNMPNELGTLLQAIATLLAGQVSLQALQMEFYVDAAITINKMEDKLERS